MCNVRIVANIPLRYLERIAQDSPQANNFYIDVHIKHSLLFPVSICDIILFIETLYHPVEC